LRVFPKILQEWSPNKWETTHNPRTPPLHRGTGWPLSSAILIINSFSGTPPAGTKKPQA